MRILIIALLALAGCISLQAQTTVYGFQIDSIAGANKINFAAFAGKKILIVNTASLDSNAAQYADLRSLNQFFKDSLVIVAIPSNSFGKEPAANADIASFYSQAANNRFPVAAKVDVSGPNIHPLFAWLAQGTQNGFGNTTVIKGFKKYLINKQGKLVAVFAYGLRPNSLEVMKLIKNIQ